MSADMLRLSLQFFAGEDEEENVTVPYESTGTGAKSTQAAFYKENDRLDEATYREQSGYLGSYDEWAGYYGYDPDADYQDTVNTLNYEYQTSMANYGQNAEQLYQMGLTNSGVSDIFQANAFSAYLNSMNEAAQKRINTKNQLKREYGEYQQNFNLGWNQYDSESKSLWNAYNKEYDQTLQTNASNGYLAVLESGLFSGERNEVMPLSAGDSAGKAFKDYDKISNYLKNLNYDDATIEAIWERLGRTDLAGLKTDRENAGYINTQGIYVGTAESEGILRATLESMKLTTSEIESVIARHKSAWEASSEGKQATVDGYVSDFGEDFDPDMDMDTFIKEVMGVDVSDKTSQAYLNAKAAWESMNSTYVADMNDAYSIISSLPASSTDRQLKNVFATTNASFTDSEIEGAIKQFRDIHGLEEEIVQGQTDAVVDEGLGNVEKHLDTKEKNTGTLTYNDYVTAIGGIESIEADYGETDATGAKKEEYRVQNLNVINGYLDGSGELDEAVDYLGSCLSEDVVDSWGGMNEDDRKRAIIDFAKSEVGSGRILPDEFSEMVSKYVTARVGDKENPTDDSIIGRDRGNSQASGLADAGELVYYLKGLKDSKCITSEQYNEEIKSIIDAMGFSVKGGQINWYDSVEGSEASVFHWGYASRVDGRESTEKALSEATAAGRSIVSVDGTLYVKDEGEWKVMVPSNYNIIGDNHTNTDEEREGIHELLVALLSSESTAETKGGGAGEASNNHNYMQSATTNPDRGLVIQEQR